ncbi:Fc.00g067880.m01.CDS01 [Cosmosporella sp. VM-42]
MSSAKGAFLVTPDKSPIQVLPTSTYAPGPHELLIRVHAVAVNPVDAFKQAMGKMMFPWLKYPLILGSDAAGEVIDTGPGVDRFVKGDRITTLALGMDKRGKRPQEGAFQEVIIARDFLSAKIPNGTSYEEASVLPLGLCTAACGLFQKDQLALEHPRVGKAKVKNGKTLVIWGASTSVGNNAVQLAVAAGYEVIATAGPKSFDSVRRLGATEVFDYASPATEKGILKALEGKTCAGLMAIGNGSQGRCIDISYQLPNRPFVAQASIDTPGAFPESALAMVPFMAGFLWGKVTMWFKITRTGVATKFIFGSDLVEWDTDGMVFRFLEEALKEGEYVTVPEPKIVGKGLEKIQEGLDMAKAGVKGVKVVVSLD